MKRSTRKVLVAIAVLIGLSAVIARFNVPAAVVVCFVGGLNILSRHLDRCHFCGSWRVTTDEVWYPDHDEPGLNEATERRICKKCRIQEINHYSLPAINPFHV